MAIALVAHTGKQSTDGNGFTTASIDTTGANLLIAVTGSGDGTPTVTDSKGNSWVARTTYGAGSPKVVIWYAKNATVGTGHTFIVTATAKFPTLCIAAFSGADTAAPYDVESGGTCSVASTVQPGSITPGSDNYLVVTSMAGDAGGSVPTANLSFTNSDSFLIVGGQAYGASLAYLIQTTATAVNPTWSWGAQGSTGGSGIASFKVGAAAATVVGKSFNIRQAVKRAATY